MTGIFSKTFIKNAEEVSLTPEEMNQMGRGYGSYGNDEKPFAGMFKRASDSAKQKAYDAKVAEIRGKYGDVLALLDSESSATEILEDLHDVVVPAEDKADTVFGEIVRAYNHIKRRLHNDGDCWFFGYGTETCASDVHYLYKTIDSVEEDVDSMVETLSDYYDIQWSRYRDELNYGRNYERWVDEGLAGLIVAYLREHNELLETPNEEDSRGDRGARDWVISILPENENYECEYIFDDWLQEDYDYLDVEREIESQCDYSVSVNIDYNETYGGGIATASFDSLTVIDLENVLDDYGANWLESAIEDFTTSEDPNGEEDD